MVVWDILWTTSVFARSVEEGVVVVCSCGGDVEERVPGVFWAKPAVCAEEVSMQSESEESCCITAISEEFEEFEVTRAANVRR